MNLFLRFLSAVGLLAALAGPVSAALSNRWSFNAGSGTVSSGTVFLDTVSGAAATVKSGTGTLAATLNGTAITLPGTTTGAKADSAIAAYLNLPNGIISSKTNLTVEFWATPVSNKSWQRYFEFGRVVTGDNLGATGEWTGASAPSGSAAYDSLLMVVEQSTTLNSQLASIKQGGSGATSYSVPGTLSTTLGTQYHYVLTFEDGLNVDDTANPAGGRLSWYRNGARVGVVNVPFHLSAIADVNNWIGRSQSSGDSMANITLNEFRIYDHALSPADITASFNAGPDATFPAPVPQPDTVTMAYGMKALVAVLANDSGSGLPLQPATVTVLTPPQYGTATPDGAGRILYAHTTGTPASDSFTYRVSNVSGASSPAVVTVSFTTALRIANPAINVPAAPPTAGVQIAPAFAGLAAFNQPVCLATAPGDTKRLFVCERTTGLLQLIPDVTAASPTKVTFLNLATLLSSRGQGETLGGAGTNYNSGNEHGLLGVAFHPNYATNGYFYVYYSVKVTTGSVFNYYDRLSRFSVQAGNPNAADPTSERILFSQLDPDINHNAGDLHFGNDGYLYLSVGDNSYNNGSASLAGQLAQRIDGDLVSGLLRIDVDKKPGNPEPNQRTNTETNVTPTPVVPLYGGLAAYSIPADNPFIGATSFNGQAVTPSQVHTEFYAVGLRNPWRFSIDTQPGGTGEIWVGDVGFNSYEEIDVIASGGNYGWPDREGPAAGPRTLGAVSPLAPYYSYPHSGVVTPANPSYEGFCTIGGVIYRGARFASLQGKYIFADYGSGNIWTLARNGSSAPTVTRVTGMTNLVAFGIDPSNGDVLALQIATGTGASGSIQRITVNTAVGTYPAKLSDTGLFADLTDLTPNPGVLPYSPNLPFWSDFAVKRRWFTIPDGTSKMTWSRDGAWTFPAGTVWVKHFDLELTRSNPPVSGGTGPRKRIETRLLVQTASGVYGVSYRWNDAGTDAVLVDEAGADFDVAVTQNGSPYTQRWHIPSRAECLACHNAQAGGGLSFSTRQLNCTQTINGFTGNTLQLLSAAGYLTNTPDSPNLLPRHVRPDETDYPLEARARSYFAVNCAMCHQAGGSGPSWDGRSGLTLAQTGLVRGAVLNNGGSSANKLIVPGDTVHSVVLSRISASNGFARMPPLGSNELDQNSIALITQWIQNFDSARLTFADWQTANFGSTSLPSAAASADPDGDGRSNLNEYLAGTAPVVAAPVTSPLTFTRSPSGLVTLSYTVSANAIAQVQFSTDLVNWVPWDVPGNDSLRAPDGLRTLQGQLNSERVFFRLILSER